MAEHKIPDRKNYTYGCFDHCEHCTLEAGSSWYPCPMLEHVCRLVCIHQGSESCEPNGTECAWNGIDPQNCQDFRYNGVLGDRRLTEFEKRERDLCHSQGRPYVPRELPTDE